MTPFITFAFLSITLLSVSFASADLFGTLDPFDIEFVNIGNPGNPGNADDATGSPNEVGKVDYAYRISTYEISREMITKANAAGGLGITLANMSSFGGNGFDKPATGVSWYEAARFVNWLNTDSNSTPAYKFDGGGNFQLWSAGDAGYNSDNLFRNSKAKYFLPSADEWYKAAYYNPSGSGSYGDYATTNGLVPTPVSSGTTPNTAVFSQPFSTGPADITQAGGLSPYGTMGQGGNVFEREETSGDLLNGSSSSARGIRGGGWIGDSSFLSSSSRLSTAPSSEGVNVGFRVASVVPEPCTALLGVRVPPMAEYEQEKRSF